MSVAVKERTAMLMYWPRWRHMGMSQLYNEAGTINISDSGSRYKSLSPGISGFCEWVLKPMPGYNHMFGTSYIQSTQRLGGPPPAHTLRRGSYIFGNENDYYVSYTHHLYSLGHSK